MQFTIDENTNWLPYRGQDPQNLYIDMINNEPTIIFVHYVKISGNHVDEAVDAGNVSLVTIDNLEQVGKLIQEKVNEFRNREP